MKNFICTFDEHDVLTSLFDPLDTEWKTNFFLSFGEISVPEGMTVARQWKEDGDFLYFTAEISNPSEKEVKADDARFSIGSDSAFVADQKISYYQRVIQHPCVCGNGSYLYWLRPSGEGRLLAMTALGDTDLCAEVNDTPYAVRIAPFTLAPRDKKTLRFRFSWMNRHSDIREIVWNAGGVDVAVFPGLVVPENSEFLIRLRCKNRIENVLCEDGEAFCLGNGIYRLRFGSLGEKNVRIRYRGESEILETRILCCIIKPVDELADAVSRHIVEKQRYTGDQWYDGLFSQWSLAERKMTTPDDPLGLPLYCVSADDPGLCKAPYIAEKNIVRPDEKEIAAVEYYIEKFLWGGLQRSDDEEMYPWGIIGSDTWKDNRASKHGLGSGGLGNERMWRTFDYTHIIQLYYNMYRIAKNYPYFVHRLSAAEYLNRASKTALAFFEVPYSIFMREPWDHRGYCDWAFKLGNFHELYILPLLDALEKEVDASGYERFGLHADAEKIRSCWETKVKYMIYDNPLPYGSEMWFDSTSFESTQAVAHYAVEHGVKPDINGFFDKNLNGPGQGGFRSHPEISEAKNRDFLVRQMTANLACRGTQTRDYTLYGSDFRAGGFQSYRLSYMAQIGGAAVLDYALYFDDDPAETARIGYASLLSGWCLVNAGRDDRFYPHPDNFGAVGWAFQPEDNGKTWAGFRCKRGPWIFDGEIQSGLSAALYASCSVLVNDPDFGTVCYGAELSESDGVITVVPKDGTRKAFHDLRDPKNRVHLLLDRDAIQKIEIHPSGELTVSVVNMTGTDHRFSATFNGVSREIEISSDEITVNLRF